jgi:hypothetical protein
MLDGRGERHRAEAQVVQVDMAGSYSARGRVIDRFGRESTATVNYVARTRADMREVPRASSTWARLRQLAGLVGGGVAVLLVGFALGWLRGRRRRRAPQLTT